MEQLGPGILLPFHSEEFVDEMLEMLYQKFSPDIAHVSIDRPFDQMLGDPTFLTKVKLKFRCERCQN